MTLVARRESEGQAIVQRGESHFDFGSGEGLVPISLMGSERRRSAETAPLKTLQG